MLDWFPYAAVDALVDRAPSVDALLYHRLGPFAARRRRALGLEPEPELVHAERIAALATATTPATIQRIRDATDLPLVLHKGPEVARCYPEPVLRPYRDLDLLTAEPEAVQRALLETGWEVVNPGGLEGAEHHELGLVYPGLPMVVEVHEVPKWLHERKAPSTEELLATAITGPDERVQVFPPHVHAVLVAVHAWAHRPLRRISDLVDIVAVTHGQDLARIDAQARRWGVERVWRSMHAAAEALLNHAQPPWTLRTWARDLPRARERSVLEFALERWTSPFAALPPRRAAREGFKELGKDLKPLPEETWPEKLRRSAQSLRDARLSTAEHERRN